MYMSPIIIAAGNINYHVSGIPLFNTFKKGIGMRKGFLLLICCIPVFAKTGTIEVTFPPSVKEEILVSFISDKSGKILFSKTVNSTKSLNVKLPSEVIWFVCSARDKVGFFPHFYSTIPREEKTTTIQCRLKDTVEVKGKLVDKKRGTPIPGAKVGLDIFFKDIPPNTLYKKALRKSGFLKEYLATTDSKGNFRVKLPVDKLNLAIEVEKLGKEIVKLDLKDKKEQGFVDIGTIEFSPKSSLTVYFRGNEDILDSIEVYLHTFHLPGNKGIDPKFIERRKVTHKVVEFQNLEEGIYTVGLEIPDPVHYGSIVVRRTFTTEVAVVLLEEGDSASLDIPIINKKLAVSFENPPISPQYEPIIYIRCKQYYNYFRKKKLKKVRDKWKAEFPIHLPCKAELSIGKNPRRTLPEQLNEKREKGIPIYNSLYLGEIFISELSPYHQEITPELPDNTTTIILRTKDSYNSLSLYATNITYPGSVQVTKNSTTPSNELKVSLLETDSIYLMSVVGKINGEGRRQVVLKEITSTTENIEVELQKILKIRVQLDKQPKEINHVSICLYSKNLLLSCTPQEYNRNKKNIFTLRTLGNGKFIIGALGKIGRKMNVETLGFSKALEYTEEPIEIKLEKTGRLAVLNNNVINLTSGEHTLSRRYLICLKKENICQFAPGAPRPHNTVIPPSEDGKVALINDMAPGDYYLTIFKDGKEIKSTNFTIRSGELTLLKQLF